MGRGIMLLWLLAGLCAAPLTAGGKEMRMNELQITSPVFAAGGTIPVRYTCDGEDVSPPLAFGPVPPGTLSLALIVDDPDAPVGVWVHWVAWNIPPTTREIKENGLPASGVQGLNDWKRNNYGGPCPPSGTHRYFFRIYALDTVLNLPPSTTKAALERAMQGHILAQGELKGSYRRH